MTTYVPGTQEKDLSKVIMSLQVVGSLGDTTAATTATNATNIATNTANIATNTANIATNTASIATNTTAISKLANNQFARVALASASQTGIANATSVKVNFDTVLFDPSSIWDATNKRFKPTIAGYYKVFWNVWLLTPSGATQFASIFAKNGSSTGWGSSVNGVISPCGSSGSDVAHFDGVTDYAEVFAFINGTASRDIQARSDLTFFGISLVKAD